MSSLLRSLKQALLPTWNAAHHLARQSSAIVEAVVARRVGHCAVCGHSSLFLYRKAIIPKRLQEIWGLNQRLAEAFARKESCQCVRCHANLRTRRLALALLELPFSADRRLKRPSCIAEWVASPDVQRFRVAEINGIAGLHEYLRSLPGHAYSEFIPGAKPGDLVDGVRHEDLTQLSYAAESFELVFTSETLEHVPDLSQALSEIHRILVPGGYHVFTIPWLPSTQTTFARASLSPEGTIEHTLPLIHHPGGDVGYPVFTEFGQDLPKLCEQAGFETHVVFGPPTEHDVAQVFVCRKVP